MYETDKRPHPSYGVQEGHLEVPSTTLLVECGEVSLPIKHLISGQESAPGHPLMSAKQVMGAVPKSLKCQMPPSKFSGAVHPPAGASTWMNHCDLEALVSLRAQQKMWKFIKWCLQEDCMR